MVSQPFAVLPTVILHFSF